MKISPESSQFNPEVKDVVKNFRTSNLDFRDLGKQRADELLRLYLPHTIFDPQQELNVIDWLTHEPTDDEPYGATDEEIKKLLHWNICHTETTANESNLDEAVETIYRRISAGIEQGKIDESWNNQTGIEGILVGNLLDAEFLGLNDQEIGAQFDHEDREIILYPYGFTPEEIDSLLQHEITHSFGGFESRWLDEGATERLNAVISNENPSSFRDQVYLFERFILKYLMEEAPRPFGDYQISAFFGRSTNHEQNQELFRQFVQESYGGLDVIGSLDTIYDEIGDERSATFCTFRATGAITNLIQIDGNSAKRDYLNSLELEDQNDQFLIGQVAKLFKL